MRKFPLLMVLLLVAQLFAGCADDKDETDGVGPQALIVGTWKLVTDGPFDMTSSDYYLRFYENGQLTYSKHDEYVNQDIKSQYRFENDWEFYEDRGIFAGHILCTLRDKTFSGEVERYSCWFNDNYTQLTLLPDPKEPIYFIRDPTKIFIRIE